MRHHHAFLSLCSTQSFFLPLHIFYLPSPRVYLAEEGLSPSTSKRPWSFVQYFTIGISGAHGRRWQPQFVYSSITAHRNNHISIVIWRRSRCNDLFALNHQQLSAFCLMYTLEHTCNQTFMSIHSSHYQFISLCPAWDISITSEERRNVSRNMDSQSERAFLPTWDVLEGKFKKKICVSTRDSFSVIFHRTALYSQWR